jgi:hypothetical protein
MAQDTTNLPKKRKVKFEIGLDIRNSFIKDAPVNVYGANIGFYVHHKFHIGLGIYTISEKSKQQYQAKSKKGPITLNGSESIRLFFVSSYFRYELLRYKKFVLSVPIELGLGRSITRLLDSTNTLVKSNKFKNPSRAFFIPCQVGLFIEWRVLPWLTPHCSIGYRYILFYTRSSLPKFAEPNFNGMYYNLGISLNLGYLIKRKLN